MSSVIWTDLIPSKDDFKNSINDITFSPDCTTIVVAVGNLILLYDAENGDLIQKLTGHKSVINTVDYSSDGSKFASGGSDNMVIIWKNTGKGLLKYTHNSSIHKVKFSQESSRLVTCAEGDVGIWNPDQKTIPKEVMPSRVISAAWSSDSSLIALGMISGRISIRKSDTLEEAMLIDRTSPVYCLAFIPFASIPTTKSISSGSAPKSEDDILVCGCWDKKLAYYRIQNDNYKLYNEKNIGFYPCSLSFLGPLSSKSSFMLISGSNKKVTLFSKDTGVKLSEVFTGGDSWIWGCSGNLNSNRVAIGMDSGTINMMHLDFLGVYALYQDRYAYRENLTEVIVHHLILDRKVRIKCRELIKHVALYHNKLAVYMSDRVCMYESDPTDLSEIHFKITKEKLSLKSMENAYTQMSLTSQNIIFCSRNVVESYTFSGKRQRVWTMDANITFMKVDGGPMGKESILIGLESGNLLKLFIDNPFPIELSKFSHPVIACDLNFDRSLVACIDSSKTLFVLNTKSQDILFTMNGVQSVCFNSELSNMLCYSSDKTIFVIAGIGDLKSEGNDNSLVKVEPQELFISGKVIGFQGQRIYCLQNGLIASIDVPQSINIVKALDSNDSQNAYSAACLGATESDWKLIAMRSLRMNSLSVAKSAFTRLKDIKYLNFIEQIEKGQHKEHESISVRNKSRSKVNMNIVNNQIKNQQILTSLDSVWNAELLAYEGHYIEAAKCYVKIGKVDEAIRLLVDLRCWDEAKNFATNNNKSEFCQQLTQKQAQWLKDTNDWKGSANLFLSMKNYHSAAKVIIDSASAANQSWQQALLDVVKIVPVEYSDVLLMCGDFFSQSNEDLLACETYLKIGEITKLMQLYVRRQMWSEAGNLAEKHEGKFDPSIFLPYAEHLISEGRYEDAMDAYRKAKRSDLANAVLLELTSNAVIECRFKDAAYFYWKLSLDPDLENDTVKRQDYQRNADLYFAYSSIHAYNSDPFTSYQPEILLQVGCFIVNTLSSNTEIIPKYISSATTLYTLAKQALKLGNYKLARQVYERLSLLRLPCEKEEEVEFDMLVVQSKPIQDNPDFLLVCFRCSTTNSLLNAFNSRFSSGDVCTTCGHAFVRSFINFDVLPLVEFIPEPQISDDEAVDLIRQDASEKELKKSASHWKEGKDGDADFLRFEQQDVDLDSQSHTMQDNFLRCINNTLAKQGKIYEPVIVDKATLLSLKHTEIYICKPKSKFKRATFYRNMLPDIGIALSQPCHRFFHLEDFEFSYLSNKGCPYSKSKNVGEYGSL